MEAEACDSVAAGGELSIMSIFLLVDGSEIAGVDAVAGTCCVSCAHWSMEFSYMSSIS